MKSTRFSLVIVVLTLLVFPLSFAHGYQCGDCHPVDQIPEDIIRNCKESGCHSTDDFDNGNHHTTAAAMDGTCTVCHDPNLVADYDEDNPSTNPPSNVTPTVQSCNNCHKGHSNPVGEMPNQDPYPFPIDTTANLEHMAGQGYTTNCLLCHTLGLPTDPDAIKQCETCHTVFTLHNIAGHAVPLDDPLPYDGYWYVENGDWNLIDNDARCFACHSDGVDPAPDTMSYVSQDVGTYDTTYGELLEGDCRLCHSLSMAERHHQLLTPPPVIDEIGNRKCYPGEKIQIRGSGFGDGQDSVVHINKKAYDSTHSRIKLWSDTLIKVKIPFAGKDCSWFKDGDGDYRKRKVWVTVASADSNKKNIRVLKPVTCP